MHRLTATTLGIDMPNLFYDEQSVADIASAIRAKDGDAATMTVAQMPARIDNLLPKGSKEVWLSAQQQQTSLVIDTGVAGDDAHHIEVIGYANIYSATTLVASRTSSTSRQGVNLLSTQNAIRVVWGNSGLKQFNYQTTNWSAWRPMVVSLSKYGMTLNGFTQGYTASTVIDERFEITASGASTANYEIFPNIGAGNTMGQPGCFRRLRIRDNETDALLHDFVPVMRNDFSLVLLDKVTRTEIALETGMNGFAGMWNPKMDREVTMGLLNSADALSS